MPIAVIGPAAEIRIRKSSKSVFEVDPH